MELIVYLVIVVLIIAPIYLLVVLFRIRQEKRRIDWLSSHEFTTLRIDVPRNNEKSPLSAEQMFASIHGIYSESSLYQSHISFEIVARDKFIQFYIFVPKHLRDFVEGQIYAQYPSVEINEVEDYTQDNKAQNINFAACELCLTKPDVYPIKFFDSFDVDPLSGITSVMSKLSHGEQVWFQVIIRPVGDSWQEKGNGIVSAVRAGKKPGGIGVTESFFKGLQTFGKMVALQAIKPGAELEVSSSEVKLPASVEEALTGIEKKITKLGFETKVRILCIAGDPVTAAVKCQSVGAAFKQFNTTNLNGFKVGPIDKNNFDAWEKFVTRSFIDYGNIFNITELASVYHLPHKSVETPNIVWSGAKKGEPPANLPLIENTPKEELTVLGVTNFRNVYREFGIKRDDRRRHIYIVGKSGTGKSTLIENMAVNDVCEGKGVIIVDPHGELADKVLSCVPSERINDVIVFDPADRAYPIGFNLLETVEDDFKGMVASGFVGIFKKIFGDSWGPRLEHILRNTVLALLDYPDSTMLDIPKMLTDNGFRDRVVEKVQDPVIRDFWVNEFAQYDNKFRTEAVSPILNKVGQFLATATIRNIVGQPRSRINIRDIMDQKKVLIVNLSRGKIGEDNSALLGAMMITKIQLAAMSRADVVADKRPDCYLYVDEFQNFATESFAVILSEARKYNLCLTMANQYIEQMSDEVRSAVFGNAGTLITFRVGGTDADFLVKEYEPVFDVNDLVNLERYTVYIKLLIDGIAPPAFSAKTLPPAQRITDNAVAIINSSHEKYSAPRALVEEQIMSRAKEEEAALIAQAEAFKQGGLAALLVKKAGDNQPTRTSKNHMSSSSLSASTPSHLNEHKPDQVSLENLKISVPHQPSSSDKKEPENKEKATQERHKKPRQLKYQNIIGNKIFKEQSVRGGERWFVGEDIDLDRMTQLNIEITPDAKKMIELAKKVDQDSSSSHSREEGSHHAKKDQKVKSQQGQESDNITEHTNKQVKKISIKSSLSKSDPKLVSNVQKEKTHIGTQKNNKEKDRVKNDPNDSNNYTQSGHLNDGQTIKFD